MHIRFLIPLLMLLAAPAAFSQIKATPIADPNAPAEPAEPSSNLPPATGALNAQEWGAQIKINQVELSKFPDVTIYATVTQGSQPLTGLTARDFRVREDDFVQAPLSVEAKRVPLSVVRRIDVSGSMTAAMYAALESAGAVWAKTGRTVM